jgi:hypothetical protein
MIPLKQTVYIVKSGQEDDWGIPQPGAEIPVKGRVDYQIKKVTASDGQEVISSATILLKGAQDVSLSDTIKWTDALGHTYERKPIQVNPLADLSSKVLFTQVIV